ncbi:MAG: phosphatase PAP2 family protein [Acidimicrobiia bacterium]|nr:phosphatase PAP2 family protein [Acidimicrobiia bacterium]
MSLRAADTVHVHGHEVHASRLRWWREILYIGAFYALYTWTRNQFGSASVDSVVAYHHALIIIDIERALGLFHEESIQGFFLGWRVFIQFWNVFYGTFHFAVTIGVLIWLFAKWRGQYAAWRNTLAFTTGLALLGFSLFPLMPPRLLCHCEYGPNSTGSALFTDDYGFVDTLEAYGGLWSFNEGTMAKVSNQYAAMPSLHFAWSTWCLLAIWNRTKHRWAKILAVLYPTATLFAIVVTANHFWLDAVGGAIVLGVGWYLGSSLANWNDRRLGAQLERVSIDT